MNRIVVLGAGYAGLSAAMSPVGRTRRRTDVRISVVNAEERFTERLRLHQTASGQQLAEPRIPELLAGTGVEFVRGWVTGFDAATRTVRVDDERVLEYDTLVYALGSVADTAVVAGVDDHAHTLNSAQDAQLLARTLSTLDGGTLAVCGSGLTGVEAAAEIAEQHPEPTPSDGLSTPCGRPPTAPVSTCRPDGLASTPTRPGSGRSPNSSSPPPIETGR